MKQKIATITGLAMLGMTFQAFAGHPEHGNATESASAKVEIRKEAGDAGHHAGMHIEAHKLKSGKPEHQPSVKVQGFMVGPGGKVKHFGIDGDKSHRPQIGCDDDGDKGIHLKFEFQLDVDGAQIEQFLDRLEDRLGRLDLDELFGDMAGQVPREDVERLMREFGEQADPEQMERMIERLHRKADGKAEVPMPSPEALEGMIREFAGQVRPEDVERLMRGFGVQANPEQMERMMDLFRQRFGGAPEGSKPHPEAQLRRPDARKPDADRPPREARRPQAREPGADRPRRKEVDRPRPASRPDSGDDEIRALRRQLDEQQEMLRHLMERLERMSAEH